MTPDTKDTINKNKMFTLLIRNLIHILRRYPLPAAINTAGLVVALTAFIIISSHIEFETGYDRSYPTSGRIFRVDCPGNTETFRSILPNAFCRDIIQSSAHIEAGTMLMPYLGKMPFYIDDRNGEPHGYELLCDLVQPDFVKVFGVRILRGDPMAIATPGKAMIPQSMAENIFGNENPIGKTMRTDRSWFFQSGEVTVGAVYDDFPANSNLRNSIYFAADERLMPYNYGSANFICYLLLDSADSATAVEKGFNDHFDFSLSWMSPIKLIPMEDIFFMGQGGDGRIFQSGSRKMLLLLSAIGILVLLSGVMNFANFFTSLAPVRIRSINTQKVVGASTAGLRVMLTMETVVISLICLAAAFFLAAWLSGAMVSANMTDGIFSIHSTGVILSVTAITLVTGILAGLYPSIYATSFEPALVLKGDFGLSKGGKIFRSIMSGIQYIIAFIILIFMTFVILQNRLIRDTELGFDKERIAVAEVSSSVMEKLDVLRAEAQNFPSISGIAHSSEKIGAQDTYSTSGIDVKGQKVSTFIIGIDKEFMKVMGTDIIEGRNFNQYDSLGTVIVNRYFMDRYGIHTGDIIPNAGQVIGVCDYIRLNSVREPEMPVLFVHDGNNYSSGILYFRLSDGSDAMTAVSEIKSLLLKTDPYWPGQIELYETILDNLYSNELRTSRLVVAFSIISVILALCGVIGLVIFDTEYRRKETAIRKVFGAGVADILKKTNMSYIAMVLICFAVSCPVAAVIVSHWLENFVDRVSLYPWVFAAVLAAILALTVLIVTSVFFRRATSNPCNDLR